MGFRRADYQASYGEVVAWYISKVRYSSYSSLRKFEGDQVVYEGLNVGLDGAFIRKL